MRPKSAKPGKKILLERLSAVWSKTGDMAKIILRNMFRNKDRMIMSVFGITCSCAMLFIALGMKSSIDNLISTVYEKVNNYDMKVYFKADASLSEAQRVVRLTGVERGELIMETGAKVTGRSAEQKTAAITVVPDCARLLGIYEGRDLDEPLPDNGCIISDMLARDLGVLPGDDIYINFTGHKKVFPLTVDKIIVLNLGQGIFVSESAWRRTGEGFLPTAALLSVNDTDRNLFAENINDYKFVLDAKFQSQLKESLEKNLEASNASVSIMILFGGVMAFTVLLNLGLLNFCEREREIATLKVIGFHNKEVKKMAFFENYIFTAMGCVFGLILGDMGLNSILAMTASEHYVFTKYLNAGTFAYSVIIIYVYAFVTNMFLSRYIKRIDMISSLKAIE